MMLPIEWKREAESTQRRGNNDSMVSFLKNQKDENHEKGACTNHVDRILGNFDPSPHVDTFTK